MPLTLRRPAALTGALFAALALLLPQAPARAATVAYALTLPDAAMPNPLADATAGVGVTLAENVTGSILNDRRSPWDAPNSTLAADNPGSVYSALRNGTASYEFGGVFRTLSLVWGTPGPLNTLTLFLGGTEVLSLTGAGPTAFSGDVNLSVLVTITDLSFDRLVAGAGNPAFEIANLQALAPAPVPVPAAGLMLAGALGGLAALRRRRAA
jgi:hypothetical protein